MKGWRLTLALRRYKAGYFAWIVAVGALSAAASLVVVVSSCGVVERVYIFSPARKTPLREPKAHKAMTMRNAFFRIMMISQVVQNSGNYSPFTG